MNKSIFLIALLGSVILGIFLGDFFKVDLWWVYGILLGLILILILFWKTKTWRLVLFVIIGLCLGATYYRFWDNRQKDVKLSYGQNTSFKGAIVGEPEVVNNQSRYIVQYQNTKIQIVTGRFPEYKYGENLRILGMLKSPNDYSFHQGILGIIYNPEKIEKVETQNSSIKVKAIRIVYLIKNKFENILNRTLPEPYSAFAAGLVFGSKTNIPDSLMSEFNITGTTHIVAVSGYNVTIIVIYIGIFFGLFSRKLKFWGVLVFILAFVIMTGASASVLRAGILSSMIAWGRYEGRRVNMTILLFLVADLMLLFNPYAIKYDISFQLSFLAFVGLIYLAPIISSWRIFIRVPKVIKSVFSETISAQIMVLPILVFYFGRVSIISPVVNILILWIIPLTMLMVFLVGIGGLIWLNFGQAISLLCFLVLKYIIVVVEYFSKYSWASVQINTNDWWWITLYLIGISLIIFKFSKNPYKINE